MNKKLRLCVVFIVATALLIGCTAKHQDNNQGGTAPTPVSPPPETAPVERDAVKEQLSTMTLDEKLGQMLIVGVKGYGPDSNTEQMIKDYKVGGFILFGSNIENTEQLLKLNNSLKSANSANKIPLFISVDEEGGRISRIPKTVKNFPSNKAIGKVNNKDFSYEVGMLLAEKVKTFGFNMDYAPVLDINSNPENPVIGDRAFGSEAAVVSQLGVQTMKGLRDGGVIPVVKHFPGHGDTSVDSHVGLPSVNNDLNRLKSFELIPFENAIKNGADCVMVAHILLPKIDANNPATLSKTIITDILRQQLDFKGVVITDDMTMGAIAKNYEIGAAAVQAVNAGCDIVLVAHQHENALAAIAALKEAVKSGAITEEKINQSVYRILSLKQKYNLKDSQTASADIGKINEGITAVLKKYIK